MSEELDAFLWEVAVELGGEVIETLPASVYQASCLPVDTCWWSNGCMTAPYWQAWWKEKRMEEDRLHRLLHREIEVPDGRERFVEKGRVVAVYTDGGVIGSNGRGGSPHGGMWAWCGIDGEGTRVIERSGLLLPTEEVREIREGVTNQHTEFYAVCKSLSWLPDGWDGVLYTDNETMIHRWRIRKQRKVMSNTPSLWQAWFWRHLDRLGDLQFVHVPGHSGVEHNEWCDGECNRLRAEYDRDYEIKRPTTRRVSPTLAAGVVAAIGGSR